MSNLNVMQDSALTGSVPLFPKESLSSLSGLKKNLKISMPKRISFLVE